MKIYMTAGAFGVADYAWLSAAPTGTKRHGSGVSALAAGRNAAAWRIRGTRAATSAEPDSAHGAPTV